MPFLSLHGRVFGFDTNTGAMQRPGFKDFFDDEEDVINMTSTAVSMKFRGNSTLPSTAIKDFVLLAPLAAGLPKTIATISTSSFARTVTLASGTFQTTVGSSASKINFNAQGQTVSLVALSTSLVQVTSFNSGVTFTT